MAWDAAERTRRDRTLYPMIGERLVDLLYQGDSGRLPDSFPIIRTDTGYYRMYLNAFERIDPVDPTQYGRYEARTIREVRISAVYAGLAALIIRLSTDEVIVLGSAEDGTLELQLDDWTAYALLLEPFFPEETGYHELNRDGIHIERPKRMF